MLIHYSHTPIEAVHDVEQDADPRQMKPKGLWVSVEGNGDGWSDWCAENDFGGGWKHVYEVKLSADANVLRLRSVADMDRFNFRFRNLDMGYYDQGYIRWGDVAESCDGIIIAPYQWERRLDNSFFWYYGWDCASGCIWRARAVESLTTREASRA